MTELPSMTDVGVSTYARNFEAFQRDAKDRFTQAACIRALRIITSDRLHLKFNKYVQEHFMPQAKLLNETVQSGVQQLHAQAELIITRMHADGAKTTEGRLYTMIARFSKRMKAGWRREGESFDIMFGDIGRMLKDSVAPGCNSPNFAQEIHALLRKHRETMTAAKNNLLKMKKTHLRTAKRCLQPVLNKLKWLHHKAQSFMAAHKELEGNKTPGFLGDLPEAPACIRRSGFEWAAYTSTTRLKHFHSCRELEKYERENRPTNLPPEWYRSASERDIINEGTRWATFATERRKLREQYTREITSDRCRDFGIVKKAMAHGVCYRSGDQSRKYAYKVVNELRRTLWEAEFPSQIIKTREDYELAAARLYERHVVRNDAKAARRENRPVQIFSIVENVLDKQRRRWLDKKRQRDRRQQVADASVYPKGMESAAAWSDTGAKSPPKRKKKRKRKKISS